jgi:Domain of unknown function (DUF4160)
VTELCRFYGIVIGLFFKDHGQPHIHVSYGGRGDRGAGSFAVVVDVRTGRVVAGYIPAKSLRLVREWVIEHAAELEDRWLAAQAGGKVEKIEPLRAKKGRKTR